MPPLASGYEALAWKDAKKGQTVWIRGRSSGDPQAYGPHEVRDLEKRTLRNIRLNRAFQEQEETLCILK